MSPNKSARRREVPRWVDALIGVGYLVAVTGFVAASVLTYDRFFVPSVDVQLTTDTLGSAMQKGSDVKLNGVPVGKVSQIESVADGAVLTLQIDPDTAKKLPTTTTARLLPKTLFGERYVALQLADGYGTGGLDNGDSIDQDRSAEAAEFDEVMDELLPLLQSIQPAKLQAALGELATMLRGNGAELGDTFAAWGDYLTKLQPQVPEMADDLAKLGEFADVYADAVPDLLAALDNFTTPARTAVKERATLAETYARVIGAADTARGWVSHNEDTIEILSAESRRALEAAAPYATEFPCLLKAVRDYIPEMDRNLGKDTDEPGIHVRLNITPSRGKYVPGTDKPVWSTNGKARCPYITGSSSSASAASADVETTEMISAPPADLDMTALAAIGLGQVNSPAENQLIAELMSAADGTSTDDYPEWGSLLLGPALRGAKVTLQ